MFSPTLNTALIAGLELTVNKALTLDPATTKALARLTDHVYLFRCTKPALDLYLIPQKNSVRLCSVYPHQADTSITGTAEDFLQLVTTDNPTNILVNSSIELHGDSDALIALQKIANNLDLDWESVFTDAFGDVVGHQLANTVRSANSFFQQTAKNIRNQVKDYIEHESELLPSNGEAQALYDDIDHLTLRIDRLEAKMNQLDSGRKLS